MNASSDPSAALALYPSTPESIAARTEPPGRIGPELCWGADSLGPAAEDVSWLWQGILARGAVTLLTSQWKSGKTTLAALILAQMRAGGAVAGRSVAAGRAVVVSEEPKPHWQRRARKLGIADHVGWFCRPFSSRPTREQWLGLLQRLLDVHAQHDLALVLIDPLAAFVVGSENDAGCMLDTLTPLEQLTREGLSVLVLHHPSKGRIRAGQAARGSGALSGYADILVEMGGAARAASDDRRRRLRAYSRYEETPRRLAMELNAEGTEYRAVEPDALTLPAAGREALIALLESAPTKLTLTGIQGLCPDGPTPDEATLRRWLDRAVAEGVVCRDGNGRKRDPFRYWLFGQEERWARDPLAGLVIPEAPGGGQIDALKTEKCPTDDFGSGGTP